MLESNNETNLIPENVQQAMNKSIEKQLKLESRAKEGAAGEMDSEFTDTRSRSRPFRHS